MPLYFSVDLVEALCNFLYLNLPCWSFCRYMYFILYLAVESLNVYMFDGEPSVGIHPPKYFDNCSTNAFIELRKGTYTMEVVYSS